MQILRSVRAMQGQALRWKKAGTPIGFVPTMGFLHAGHASLMQRARRAIGVRGKLVVSIFVNPTQFGAGEDFGRYPRNLGGDLKLCREAGVDAVFAPSTAAMYGGGPEKNSCSTFVVEEGVSRGMEGAARPSHFRGVTTVVAKLFQIVQPDTAVFGAKDIQQAAVVRRMTRDLNMPVGLIIAPTVRERDGLALSSRNRYLTPAERAQAVVLWQALCQASAAVRGCRRGLAPGQLRSELTWLIETRPAARVDYIEFFDARTLRPVDRVARGTHMALAVYVGKTRLIDNARL